MSIEDFAQDLNYSTPSGEPLNELARNPHLSIDVVHTSEAGGGSGAEVDPVYMADKPNIALKSEVGVSFSSLSTSTSTDINVVNSAVSSLSTSTSTAITTFTSTLSSVDGGDLVGYKLSTSIPTVLRTVNDRGGDRYSLTDIQGVDRTGVLDCAPAFTLAGSLPKGSEVWIPFGTYNIETLPTLANNVTFKIQGGATFIGANAAWIHSGTNNYGTLTVNTFVELNTPGEYGDGTMVLKQKGQNNNQPGLWIEKRVASASYGNSSQIVISNIGGDTIDNNSAYSSAIEIISQNPMGTEADGVTPNLYGGKGKIEVVSNRDTGDVDRRDGYMKFQTRRGDLSTGGKNTGFEENLAITYLTSRGQGKIKSRGNGLWITPVYDFGTASVIEMENNFQSGIFRNISNLLGKFAAIENTSADTAYIKQEALNRSQVFIRSLTETAYVQIKGETAAQLEMQCGTGLYRQTVNPTGNYSIAYNDGVTTKSVMNISSASDGLALFTRFSDSTRGRIQLGSAGVVLEGSLIAGELAVDGRRVQHDATTQVAIASGGSLTMTSAVSNYLLFNSATVASYTLNLPVTPPDGFLSTVTTFNAITSVTFDGGGATVRAAPTALGANDTVSYKYRAASNTWWLVGKNNVATNQLVANASKIGQIKANYSTLSLGTFTANVAKTFDINAATATISASPTTIYPAQGVSSYAALFDAARGTAPVGRLIENPVNGQFHTWRVQGTFTNKTSASTGVLYLTLSNPVSGFSEVATIALPAGVTTAPYSATFTTIADPGSIVSPNGYILTASVTVVASTIVVNVSSITRYSSAMQS